MPVFPSRPLNPSRLNTLLRKQPLFFGVPFIALMVATSFGLATVTQVKYDVRDQRVKQVTKEQELKLEHDRKKFDIREEYFRLSAQPDEDWDMKRVPRPQGTPEWGVPPPEPETKRETNTP
ncbi:cytochrome c oxidase assembly protein COX16-domain-containing protein [Mycena olivaceomarginata]|uniref:Cytochrome c oxidase assembly protein COX16, mitochondrial n=1 Tax=Mycena albidolilacea TaxID=1033008 RepID=A0AAD7ABD3_9AGAR|nr:cytochrome c oxidase assembly protein COX16-domain-containing protein [Mycena albidolilacea]KAJ7817853.1 cytochrome c oxidase assembly protein COX16-domain-containing protein [Mycena olivaceomarginata]